MWRGSHGRAGLKDLGTLVIWGSGIALNSDYQVNSAENMTQTTTTKLETMSV